MTVRELIAQLRRCDPELEVYTFNDNELNEITFVDEMDNRVDINLGKSL